MRRSLLRLGNSKVLRFGFLCCLIYPIYPLFAIKIPKPTLSGDFLAQSEIYNSSDKNRQRKPPYAYNFSLNSSLGFPFFSIGLGLFYTSDDRFTAQRVHQFNLNPSWKWGRIYLGDFSPSFSEYTLSGVSVYGAGIELFPRWFRFSFVGGRSKRADTIEWSYNRNLYALKLGTDFLFLNILKVKDDTGSVKARDTVPTPAQENLVAGFGSKFTLFNMFAFDFEGAGSAHTRNLRSDTIYLREIPKFVYSLYEPRYSSRADFTLRGGLRFSHKFFSLDVSLTQIGPGFTSLGLNYLKNDSRKGKIGISTKIIPKTDVGLSLEKEYDNVIKDKLATSKTNGLSLFFRTTPLKQIQLNLNYSRSHRLKDVPNDSFRLNTLNQTLTFTPTFNFSFRGFQNNGGLILTYQDYKNRAPLSQTPPNQTLTIGLNYSITPKIPVTFSSSFSHTINLVTQDKDAQASYQSYSLTATPPLFKDKLRNTITFSYQPSTLGRNFSLTCGSVYSLTKRDALNLNLYLSLFSSSSKDVKNFSSQKASLTYARRIF